MAAKLLYSFPTLLLPAAVRDRTGRGEVDPSSDRLVANYVMLCGPKMLG